MTEATENIFDTLAPICDCPSSSLIFSGETVRWIIYGFKILGCSAEGVLAVMDLLFYEFGYLLPGTRTFRLDDETFYLVEHTRNARNAESHDP